MDELFEKATTILVCQCDSTDFEVKKQNKTSVVLSCRDCGTITDVKGNVTNVSVENNKVIYALNKQITPDFEKSKKKDKIEKQISKPEDTIKPKFKALSKKFLRFRVTKEFQYPIIKKALDVIRVLNLDNGEFRDQGWMGRALEFICADFLAGADPSALDIVDQMDKAVERIVDGVEGKVTKRGKRRITQEVRDDMAKNYGLMEKTENEEYIKLRDAVSSVIMERLDPKEYMIKKDLYKSLCYHWDKNGGYLIEICGRKSQLIADKKIPTVYVWLKYDSGLTYNIIKESYYKQLKEIKGIDDLVISEVVPHNYDNLNEEEKWEQISIASERICIDISAL